MMRVLRGAILAIALLVAVFLLFAPLALGYVAETAYGRALADLVARNPGLEIIQDRYERGWFSSSATTELLIHAEGDARATGRQLHLRLDSRVDQGPLHWIAHAVPPVVGRVQSRLEIQGLPLVLPVLPLEIDLRLDGSGLARLDVPAGETPATSDAAGVRHGVIRGEAALTSDQRITAWLDLPELEILGGRVAVARLTAARLDLERPAMGSGVLRLNAARLDLGAVAAARPIAPALGVATEGAWIEGLTASLFQARQDPLSDLRLTIAAESAGTASSRYGRSEIGFVGERLDVQMLGELAEGLSALVSGQVAQEMRGLVAASLFARLVPSLLDHGTRLAIEPLLVQTGEGLAQGHLELSLEGAGGTAASGLLARHLLGWLAPLRAEGALDVPESLAIDLLTGGTGDADARAEAAATLNAWASEGWVTRRDAHLSSALRFGDGLLTINGKTLPLRLR